MTYYIISLNDLSLQRAYDLYNEGYELEFYYKANIPYVLYWKR